MQYEEALEPDGVAITVALLYGSPHERRVAVDTVHVSSERPARVDALEAFGIQPVAFSLVPLPPVQLHQPSIISPSSDLEVSVDELMKAALSPAPSDYAAWLVRVEGKYRAWRSRIGS